MFINAVGHYLPSEIVSNEYFQKINGLSDEWITARTGIKTRRKASEDENTNTMAKNAVEKAQEILPYSIQDVDLVIGTSYTPYDTVGTIAHYIQQQFNIATTKSIYISSACSSFINGIEITQGYFALNKAEKALIVASEYNSLFNNEENDKSGHLWGDGAGAAFISNERLTENDMEIIDVVSHGLGNVGKGPDGVYLRPGTEGLIMPYGKDVFIHACSQMVQVTNEILERNNLSIDNISMLIPHQANIRIIKKVAENLKIEREKVVINVNRLGNTGCASTVIGLCENYHNIRKNEFVVLTVFGGGYSSGAVLLRR